MDNQQNDPNVPVTPPQSLGQQYNSTMNKVSEAERVPMREIQKVQINISMFEGLISMIKNLFR